MFTLVSGLLNEGEKLQQLISSCLMRTETSSTTAKLALHGIHDISGGVFLVPKQPLRV